MKRLLIIPVILFGINCSLITGPSPVITQFTADNYSISVGSSTVLRWDVSSNADVRIDTNIGSPIGNVPNVGSAVVAPVVTTTYILSARNRAGSVQRLLTITVR